MTRRFHRFSLAFFCAVGLVLCLVRVTSAEDIKNLRPAGYVMDLAHVMDPQPKGDLEALCTELQEKTGAQMAIVTVNSLEGSDIETYAVDLYKQLGVGSKKTNEGVLLLVAPNQRKYRIEVGYGAEPVITDARAGDAGRMMVPYFRRGDYSGGITAAAWQLAKYIADDKGVILSGAPKIQPPPRQERDFGNLGFWIFVILFLLFGFLSRLRRSSSNIPRRGGGGWWIGPMIGGGWGGRSGGGGWSGGGWGGSGGGFGGFGGGMSGGGGASGGW